MDRDFELLDAWGAGDNKAASELFHRHFRAMYRFFRSKVAEGAEDLVQETFLACVESRDKFRRDSTFRTFLYATARNVLSHEYRRRKKGTDSPDFGVSSLNDLGPTPTKILAEKGEQRLLLEGLRNIPLDYQIALELYHWENMTGPQLAEVLGIPEPAVRSRLRRAKERLREVMEEIAESPELLESTMANLDDWAQSLREFLDEDAA